MTICVFNYQKSLVALPHMIIPKHRVPRTSSPTGKYNPESDHNEISTRECYTDTYETAKKQTLHD